MAAKTGEPEVAPRVEQERTLLTWKAPSRPYRASQKQFMTVPLVIGVLVGLILLLAGEWMLIAVVAALIFAYYVWSTVPPEEAEYSLTNRGVRVHGQLYVWEAFTRWWMEEKWGHKLVALEAPRHMVGRVLVPLGSGDEKKVEEIVSKFVLREKPADTAVDKAGKWLAEKFPLEEKI